MFDDVGGEFGGQVSALSSVNVMERWPLSSGVLSGEERGGMLGGWLWLMR